MTSQLTTVAPQPETVRIVPTGGLNSDVGGGRFVGLADGTLRSNDSVN